jgi:hypothetical protein
MELALSMINRIIILNRIWKEYIVIMGLDTNGERQGPVAVSSEQKNEPVNCKKVAECLDHLKDSWGYLSWRQNNVAPVCKLGTKTRFNSENGDNF